MYLFSLDFINRGIDSWFRVEIKQGLNDAVVLARAALDLRLREQALIARKLALVLRLQKLVGPRIDLRERIALLDRLPFSERHFHELAVDLRLHGDGRNRRDGAERVDDDADVARSDGGGADRLSRGLRITRAGRLTRENRSENQIAAEEDGDENDQSDDNASFSTGPADDGRRGHGSANIGSRLVIRSARSLVHRSVVQ